MKYASNAMLDKDIPEDNCRKCKNRKEEKHEE
jgi:hypothetical protein